MTSCHCYLFPQEVNEVMPNFIYIKLSSPKEQLRKPFRLAKVLNSHYLTQDKLRDIY